MTSPAFLGLVDAYAYAGELPAPRSIRPPWSQSFRLPLLVRGRLTRQNRVTPLRTG
jgi:hypothetical protein